MYGHWLIVVTVPPTILADVRKFAGMAENVKTMFCIINHHCSTNTHIVYCLFKKPIVTALCREQYKPHGQ